MHRKPEVLEEKVTVVECFDGLARIILKELAPIHSVKKWHLSRMLVLQVREWMQIWEKCSYAHRQVEEQPGKRSKKNDDKSAVAMLKKGDWQESIRQPVVNRDKSHDRPGQPVVKRDTRHELNHGPVGCRSSSTRKLGCVLQDIHAETNPTCETHESYCTSH